MHTLWVWGHAWGAQGAQRVCQRGARVPEAANSERPRGTYSTHAWDGSGQRTARAPVRTETAWF